MPTIKYDPSRIALYTPEKRETLFRPSVAYTDLQLAVECARLAYVRAEKSQDELARLTQALAAIGFESPDLMLDAATGTEVFAAIRYHDKTAIIACRGTQPGDIKDLARDLSVINCEWPESAGRVHSGFAKATRAVLPQIRAWLDQYACNAKLILTGHSLGAAIATLLASVLRPHLLVTVGSPRVGDKPFAESLAGVDIQRMVNCCDAVTDVPPELPMYTHVGKMIYINREGVVVPTINAAKIKADRFRGRIEYFIKYSWKPGSVLIRDLADHAPINYLRALASRP